MFTSWMMLVVSFVIAIFAANLLAALFTHSGIKVNSKITLDSKTSKLSI
jgi:hypothetical protein